APVPQAGQGRTVGVRRARASFVEESLFGSPARTQPVPPGFDPPWVAAAAAPGSGPRPEGKCRLRSSAPSFCDETLFGARPRCPDVARLQSLLWSPPPAPRARETSLRTLHPRDAAPPAAAGSQRGRKGNSSPWQPPDNDSCSQGWSAPGRGRSQSLSLLNIPSGSLHPAANASRAERSKALRPLTAPATPRGPVMRGRSESVSGPRARSFMAVGGCKPRPPWK
ncbi:RITA1 protein, partial [Upupa epops]|nr:RITA1 protein [Upupa epops]